MNTTANKVDHTPGPWKTSPLPVICAKGSPFKIIDEHYRAIRAGRGWYDYQNPDGGFGLTGYLTPANAKLIAAAPEMLEALQLLINLTDQGREGGLILSRADRKPITNADQDTIDQAFIAAEAAIRKARGE